MGVRRVFLVVAGLVLAVVAGLLSAPAEAATGPGFVAVTLAAPDGVPASVTLLGKDGTTLVVTKPKQARPAR